MMMASFSSDITLHIDASRLRSGGGVLHLTKLLENKNFSRFDKIIIHTYADSVFESYACEDVIIKADPLLNNNRLYQVVWQRFLLPKLICPQDLLFTIDSTSFCVHDRMVVLNQDIIGFQEHSYELFSLRNRVTSFVKCSVARKAVARSVASIFTTKYAAEEVRKSVSNMASYHVIPHGMDGEFLTQKTSYTLEDGSLKIIYVSSILEYKNHSKLISAIQKLEIDKKVTVYFAGDGDPELVARLRKQSVDCGEHEFHFLGFIEREEVLNLTRACDIAVFLSSVECFGITLLEYMRMGMPIVCSEHSSLPETLENGGVLVDPLDELAILRGISALEADEVLRKNLGLTAHRISNKYSWVRTAEDTFSVLNQFL